jgi:hypothetical protein
MNTRKDQPEDQALLQALRALARQDEGLSAPRRVEIRLMRAFDETRTTPSHRRATLGRQFLKAAAVFTLAVVAGYWWSGGGPAPRSDQRPAPSPVVPAAWPSSDALPWLDPEPGSLQIVYVQVTGEALAAQGYSVGDPDGDGLVDLEVIVGLDGLARGVRVAPASAVIY